MKKLWILTLTILLTSLFFTSSRRHGRIRQLCNDCRLRREGLRG